MTSHVEQLPRDWPWLDVPTDWLEWDHSFLPDVDVDDPHAVDVPALAPCADALRQTALEDSDSILDAEPESLTVPMALDLLVELQRAQSRLAALEARALVVVSGSRRRERLVEVENGDTGATTSISIADEVREEIAAALHRSPGTVHDQLVTARLLAGPLSATCQALADGRITSAHARAIADQARRLSTAHATCHQPPEQDRPADAEARVQFTRDCARLQERVLPTAERTTPGKTRSRAKALVAAIDAAGQEQRRLRARALIHVRVYTEDDGLAVLFARMPLADAARAHAALDARARATRADCHATLGQLRVQALVESLCGTALTPATPRAAAARVTTEIQVVVDAAVVLSNSDRPGTMVLGHDGSQPISAQAVRDLLADPDVPTVLRRLVTEPTTGHLLDRGRTSYRVTDAMRRYLAARDTTCRHPGCTRPASGCQIDHAVAWDDDGNTDRENLGPLCTRHHQLKTHAGWDVLKSRQDGSVVWRSPHGRTYEVDPPPFLVRHDLDPIPEPIPGARPAPASPQPPPGGADPPF